MVGGTTPPQSDSSEISRVLVLNLLWQSKRCSRTAPDISVLTTPSLLSRGTGHRAHVRTVVQRTTVAPVETSPHSFRIGRNPVTIAKVITPDHIYG